MDKFWKIIIGILFLINDIIDDKVFWLEYGKKLNCWVVFIIFSCKFFFLLGMNNLGVILFGEVFLL